MTKVTTVVVDDQCSSTAAGDTYKPTITDTVPEDEAFPILPRRPPTPREKLFKNIRRLSPLAQVFVLVVFVTCGFVLREPASCPLCVPCKEQTPELKQKIAYLFNCGVKIVIESTLTQYCVSKTGTHIYQPGTHIYQPGTHTSVPRDHISNDI